MSDANPRSLDQLREEVAQFQRQIDDLGQRVAGMQAAQRALTAQVAQALGQAETMPWSAKPAPAAGETYEVAVEAELVKPALVVAPLRPRPAALPSATAASPAAHLPEFARRAAKAARSGESLETQIGARLLTWVGSLVMLLALGFTVHWLWTTFETPPWLKVAGLHVLGLGLLIGGQVGLRRQMQPLGYGLTGLGLFTLYATAFAAFNLYQLYSSTAALVECTAISVAAIGLAVATNSAAVVLLGALGGYAAPILTSQGPGSHVALFLYYACLNLALLASSVWRGWQFLKPLAWLATAAMFGVWLESGEWHNHRWSTFWLGGLHTLLFQAAAALPVLAHWRRGRNADLSTVVGSGLGFLGLAWVLFHELPTQQLALLSWGLAVAALAMFGIAWLRAHRDDKLPRAYLALSAALFTLAVPLQLDDFNFLGVAWCVEALIFTALGVYFCDAQLRLSGLAVFVLAAVRLMAFDFPLTDSVRIGPWDLRQNFLTILTGGALGMAAGALHWLLPRRGTSNPWDHAVGKPSSGVLLVGGNLLALAAAACQWEGRELLTIVTLDAAAIWALGFWFDSREARLFASAIGICGAGALALNQSIRLEGPFRLAFNARFASLALLAAVYFAAGWAYWQRSRSAPAGRLAGTAAGPDLSESFDSAERGQHVLLAVLANLALVWAISADVVDWFRDARSRGQTPFADMAMAQQATLSVVWAVYAAALVAAGFALRYKVYRLLGLAAFAPILLKVFLVDLSRLELFPRVLALAVLGMMLLGTSALYQKFAAGVRSRDEEHQ